MSMHPLDILLVEDNEAHALLVTRNLTRHPVANSIHLVTDGQAALEYLRREGEYADPASSPRPHVILLDLRLPKVDGLEVLAAVKGDEGLRSIPVVVLTTSEAEGDVARAYSLHANSYLVKPVDFSRFHELMEHLGFYWLACNSAAPAPRP